ncbi:integrase family protein [Thauera sp. CAU 1555]|uniref:Integrase family protein n=1 Tax=Thauera sedimentorum TaxID=2767595 RepID=A0ABR9B780_9RHOO|nr:integrase family protein [Thauera sedimentorum]MBC9070944.1 integrase family protein [Thauera sedimentorum]MBD8501863.1 integrase family protein [Thauera sedimentorum]
MQRERLTPDRIRRFTCSNDAKQAFLWDTEAPRLAVRATAGAKSFIFESKLDRRTIRVTIGDVRAWNLDDARTEARRLQTLVDQGTDPREQKRERIAAAEAKRAAAEAAKGEAERQSRYTLRALCNAYVARLERAGKAKSAASTRSAFKCHVFPHAEIADTPARAVTAHQIAALVRRVREAGKERAAGVLRSYLSAAFNTAKRAPFDSALPADLIPFGIEHNPVDVIPAIAVQRGERTLSAGELRAYIGHLLRIGHETGPELADVALLLALYAGGQRMAQLLRAKAGDFDQDTATLRLWDGKGKRTQPREHLLPLAPLAARMVASLVERAKARETDRAKAEGRAPELAGLWLFSTHGRVAMNPETVSNRAAEICAAIGGEHFTLRDIRRTVETMLAGLGISKDTRAQLLSHGISGVQAAHYDRHAYTNEKRAALVAWEARLEAIRQAEKQPANVRRLRAA